MFANFWPCPKAIFGPFETHSALHDLRITVQRYVLRAYTHEECGKNTYFVVSLHYLW